MRYTINRMTYMVKPGDTLWDIAYRELGNHSLWKEIAFLNHIHQPYKLLIGQILRLPNTKIALKNQRISDNKPLERGTNSHLARGFLFILSDEVLPQGKLVRKVLPLPQFTTTKLMAAKPELFGIKPRNSKSTISLGEHALGNNNSRFISASAKPKGAPNFKGRPVFIDKAKIQAAGIKIHSTQEIANDLNRISKAKPQMATTITKLKDVITNVEGEVLIEGTIPPSAIKSRTAMGLTRSLRFVQFVGFTFTVYDLSFATNKSVKNESFNPIVAESIRQTGGWAGAITGIKIGGATGALMGIETGPGSILTGALGALVFGTAGYFGFDWIADFIDEN